MKGSPLIPLFLVGSFANGLCVAAEPSGRIVGRVTVEKSGEPVAGAKITAMTGMSDDHPGKRYASTSTLTNERGEYELRVPFGNITIWLPDPPAGFWQVGEQLESIAVTHKKPAAERSYKVRRGSVWRLIAKTTNDKPIAVRGS